MKIRIIIIEIMISTYISIYLYKNNKFFHEKTDTESVTNLKKNQIYELIFFSFFPKSKKIFYFFFLRIGSFIHFIEYSFKIISSCH